MKATVDHRKDAKPGDMLWVWDEHRSYRVDGKYIGRGCFVLERVESVNRVTITMEAGWRFDIKTGQGRSRGGYSHYGDHVCGEAELADHCYYLGRFLISRLVERATTEQLKAIAQILGHMPESPPIDFTWGKFRAR